jgi:hypothetical protein
MGYRSGYIMMGSNNLSSLYVARTESRIEVSIDITEVFNISSSYILAMTPEFSAWKLSEEFTGISSISHSPRICPSSSISIQISSTSSIYSLDPWIYGYHDTISVVVFIIPGIYLISVSNYTRISFQRIWRGDRSRCIFQ